MFFVTLLITDEQIGTCPQNRILLNNKNNNVFIIGTIANLNQLPNMKIIRKWQALYDSLQIKILKAPCKIKPL